MSNTHTGSVYSINGPVVRVQNADGFLMSEMVYVGERKLVGEVISIDSRFATIQVYENTTGLSPGEPVHSTGAPICAQLGPGILSGIFDGIGRPLHSLEQASGAFIGEGLNLPTLDSERLWDVKITVDTGDALDPGQIFATCPETPLVEHRAVLPPDCSGTVIWAAESGQYRIHDVILRLKAPDGAERELTLCHNWPIRTPRPVKSRRPITQPLVTGQRVIDSLFPIAKGGTAAIPGGFGTGKTMTQHQLAKWCDADIIVYIGCGERGNEMTQVLEEFTELVDPKSGHPLTDRTVLIANTSNMPVAAREASIYYGITLAEYYRDMGYSVAIMADSTSRWAEALREISGRLEEMPAEEGFPAYLPSRISQFYERAGEMETLSGRGGSVTIIGAVSPQGADFSEPVTQNTRRFVRSFWMLDKALAYSRHYPAINWTGSYSEYMDDLARWYTKNVGWDFTSCRQEILGILHSESSLMEIVKLIGADVLPDDQKLIIETARLIRVGFLQQNAFHDTDTCVPLAKQLKMMQVILYFHKKADGVLQRGVPVSELLAAGFQERLVRMKYDVGNEDLSAFDDYYSGIDALVEQLLSGR